jgi:hypothetical protein
MQRFSWALAFCSLLATVPQVSASQFYVFPVKEIEGVSSRGGGQVRPLLDRRVVDLLSATAQRDLLEHFVSSVAHAYPSSIVHARQVRDVIKGNYQFIDNDSHACGEGFVAPIASSYAMALGITRASYYEVDRGSTVELLVPVTLNLQFIKPERAKVAYTLSETVYTPFLFTKEEYNLPQAKAIITQALLNNTKKQISSLLQSASKSFNPKQTVVRLVGRDGKFYVADKGFEIGFQAGQEVEGTSAGGKQVIFRTVSVDSGYTVLLPLAGSPSVDEEYAFIFETAVDDARKPKLMPVTSIKPDKLWTHAVADLFSKDIGFNASFQITPVDTNFSDTMSSVQVRANCVPWDKYPSARTIADSRTDTPNFFLHFEHATSPVAMIAGRGGVKATQSFVSIVNAKVIDNKGNIISSELGADRYELERTGNQGLSIANAQEIALKNATAKLAANFTKSAKLVPAEFRVAKASRQHIWIEGMPVNGQNAVIEILRPLKVKVGGKPAMMKLALDPDTTPPESDGSAARIAYTLSAPDVPAPAEGDIVRILTPLRGRLPEMAACGDIYRAPGTMISDYLVPMLNHVAYRTPKYQVSVSDKNFYDDANRLLEAGFYKYRIPAFSPTEYCFRPGYKVVETAQQCSEGCSSTFLNAATVIVEKGGSRTHEAVQAQQLSIDGFSAAERANFIALKSTEETLRTLEELSRKFNIK